MREQQGWNRREFLKGAGVAIGLPFFPSLYPGAAWADEVKPPARLMFMAVPIGFIENTKGPDSDFGEGHGWFPEDDGPAYRMPVTHASLEPYRQHVSFLKGLCNKKYHGNPHTADDVWLTCADVSADPARLFSNTISCDQLASVSEVMGGKDVRFPSLTLGIRSNFGECSQYTGGLSWNRLGVPITPQLSPAQVFDSLFGKDDLPAETRLLRLREGRSVLDQTMSQVQDLNRKLNDRDRRKLDEVASAVRELEAGIQREEEWIRIPKAKAPLERPDEGIDTKSIRHARAMFDLAHAALVTDSTRIITYKMPEKFSEITPYEKHPLSHPYGNAEMGKQSVELDAAVSEQVAYFLKSMTDTKEHDGQPLIHHTLAAFGAAVWGKQHGTRNVPTMLIGHGGGKVNQGVTRTYPDPTPLANLWLAMMQTCGLPERDADGKIVKGEDGEAARISRFADSTGVLDGLLR